MSEKQCNPSWQRYKESVQCNRECTVTDFDFECACKCTREALQYPLYSFYKSDREKRIFLLIEAPAAGFYADKVPYGLLEVGKTRRDMISLSPARFLELIETGKLKRFTPTYQ